MASIQLKSRSDEISLSTLRGRYLPNICRCVKTINSTVRRSAEAKFLMRDQIT